jgi:hypothetical protein
MDTFLENYAALKNTAELLSFKCYIRTGKVPQEVRYILQELQQFGEEMKYDPNQPRVPAGSSDGGQWTSGGARDSQENPSRNKPKKPSDVSLRATPNAATEKRARAIYGETSGLFPQLKNKKLSVYNPKNWDEASSKKLHNARVYIGVISVRNPKVHFAKPRDAKNPIQSQIWDFAVDAGLEAGDDTKINKRIKYFFLRQDGIGRQTPPWAGFERLLSVGPFNNVGGGDVPKGPNTYIDFYAEPIRSNKPK